MLIDTLNECIIEIKAINELKTVSADTKMQATLDYNFKQQVISLKQKIEEVDLAVKNSDFCPSTNVVSKLKSSLEACNKVIQTGAANNATTTYIISEIKKLNTEIGQEWADYYTKSTAKILSLLDTVKGVLPYEDKVKFTVNKIKKAATWNITVDNYNYLKQGLAEVDQILDDLDLDRDSDIMTFLNLVSEGNATIRDLTDEILDWIKAEDLGDKMFIGFG